MLSAEIVALRATLSSAPSGHLPSKEGLTGARFARFFYAPSARPFPISPFPHSPFPIFHSPFSISPFPILDDLGILKRVQNDGGRTE